MINNLYIHILKNNFAYFIKKYKIRKMQKKQRHLKSIN